METWSQAAHDDWARRLAAARGLQGPLYSTRRRRLRRERLRQRLAAILVIAAAAWIAGLLLGAMVP